MVAIMSKSKQYYATLCNYDNAEMSMYNIFAVCNNYVDISAIYNFIEVMNIALSNNLIASLAHTHIIITH